MISAKFDIFCMNPMTASSVKFRPQSSCLHENEKNKRIGLKEANCVVLFVVVYPHGGLGWRYVTGIIYDLCACASSIVVEIIVSVLMTYSGNFAYITCS